MLVASRMDAQNEHYYFDRMDAAESIFFSRQLEHIRAGVFDKKYAVLKGRGFVPLNTEVNPGASTFTYRVYDEVGMAVIISDYSKTFPRADVSGTEVTSVIRGIGDSYGYSIMEGRASMMAGVALPQRKANAARKAIEQKLDTVIQTGDTANSLGGLLNITNAIAYTVPNGAAGSATWALKTPDEIVADLHGIVSNMVTVTKEIEQPDSMILPVASYQLIATKRMGDGSDITILKHFLETSPYIKTVSSWYACDTAGGSSSKRMVIYRKDPDVLELIIPQEFEQFLPEQRGAEVLTLCHLRTGGVVCYFPLAVSYGDGI